jgi:hypothetical protein
MTETSTENTNNNVVNENGNTNTNNTSTTTGNCPGANLTNGGTEAAFNCNSIQNVNRIVKMGNGTFFTPCIGRWSYEFIVNYYLPFYSVNGIRLNRQSAIEKYKREGIFKNQFINSLQERINFFVVRNCNTGYAGLSNIELVDKIFTQGICNDITIDNVPENQCLEASPAFPILDYDLDEICTDNSLCSIAESCTDNFNFFTDLFDYEYILYCYRDISRYGYTGCSGAIEWYMTEGIFRGAKYNRYGNYIDLNFVACANNLTQLITYRQVTCWLFRFGICDRDTLFSVPKIESCLSSKLSPYNYSRNIRIAQILDKFINTQCVSAEAANNANNCNSYVNKDSVNYEPDACINWNCYGNLLSTNNFSTNTNTNTNTNINNCISGNCNLTNNQKFYGNSNLVNGNLVNGNIISNASTINNGVCSTCSRAPTLATRNTFNSLNYRAKVDSEQESIVRNLPNCGTCGNSRTVYNVQNVETVQNIPQAISYPAKCSCNLTTDSYGTANAIAGSNPQNACSNCITQYNAFTPVNQPINYVTPLTLTLNQTPPSLNGTVGNSLLLSNNSFNTNGTVNTNTVAPSTVSILNGTAGIGGGLFGGCCNQNSRYQPYYNNGMYNNFYSLSSSNRAYFG